MALRFAALIMLSLALLSTCASADISSLRYNRFGRLTTRLQRQEDSPTPYPAAGYRPSEPFDFPSPDEQQFLPEQPRPVVPPQPQPQFPLQPQLQPQPQSQPQQEVGGFDIDATPNLGSNGDSIDTPSGLYETPARFRQTQATRQQLAFSRQQFSANVPQRPRLSQSFQRTSQASKPQRIYETPADSSAAFTRQRQQNAAAQPSFLQASQRFYNAPAEEEPQAERLTSAVKSERLTAAQPEEQREEREDEDEDEVVTDIEVNEVKKTTTSSTPAAAAPTPTTSVFYYPAGAIGFVHPITAGYYQPSAFIPAAAQPTPAIAPAVVTAATPSNTERKEAVASPEAEAKQARTAALVSQASIPTLDSAAVPQYFAASPYLQQYAFAAPAQLQAW